MFKHLLFSCLPRENQYLYRLCKKYVDRYRNENNGDMRNNGEERFLASVLPVCRVVFDVGANVGDWAKMALSINPSVNLHCFEPSHATYQRLVVNRFPPNVVCNNIGLGSNPSEGRLLVFEDGSGLNSLYRREGLEAGWGIDTDTREESIQMGNDDDYLV